ncbi:hypothetical protein AAVH_24712 [Aphelenchoides avenae]|nr:hypothetical protein AAVH_24712 [Aphelenchus avenae]
MHLNAATGPPSYPYMKSQGAFTDASFTEALLHPHQQQLTYGQGVFPYTSSSPREDPLAAHFASLVSLESQIPSKFTSAKRSQDTPAASGPTPFDEETIARALSLIASAPYSLPLFDNGNVPNILSQQVPLLMVLPELQRQQQQHGRAAEIIVALQQQRQELCRASLGLLQHATSPQSIQYKNSFSDTLPVLERQSPEKPPSPKKRHHRGQRPLAKRLRASPTSPLIGTRAGDGTVATVKGTTSPSTSPGGSDILQQLIDDDSHEEDVEKHAATLSTIGSDSPHRHHPNYLPKRDPEAALLEDYATVYMLNGLGGLCEDRLEKSLEEAFFDTPSDSSSPSSDEYLRNVCSSDGADASPVFPRAS